MMKPPRTFRVIVFLLTVLSGSTVSAHDPGMSSAHVVSSSSRITVTLSLSEKDVASLLGLSTETFSESSAKTPLSASAISAVVKDAVLLDDGVSQQSPADLRVSVPVDDVKDVTVTAAWLRLPVAPARLEFAILHKLAFGHRMVVTANDSTDPVGLLDRRHASYALPTPVGSTEARPPHAGPATATRWFSFFQLGIEHIIAGFDHLCFLCALLLVAGRLREIFAVVSTFTIAHSLTLAAAATGVVGISPGIVEPLIAASIIYIGVENLFLRRAPRHRLAVVFAFGLIHGLGFASALGERLPGMRGLEIIPPLLGFNVGVEFGQLAVAGVLVPLIHLARSRPSFALRLQPALSLAIAVAGTVWFFQRV